MTNTTFQIGTTYTATSAADHNCKWSFTVVARTAKFITLQSDSFKNGTDHNDMARVGIYTWDGVESARPFGSYSMAPIIRADRAVALVGLIDANPA